MTTNRSRPSEGISRQSFLRGAVGVLATGAVLGTARAAADPVGAGWGGLASSIGGSVLLPANGAQFSSSKQVFNSFYNNSNPAAVVTVSSQADVQKAVAFAKANNLKIAPRGGGHSYVGASSAPGTMVLDLRGLPGKANFDGGNVTVTPATNLYAVHQALAGAGRAVPTGTCPTVGMGGLALGGGLGPDARRAGLTCDALQSATVVLPSGDVVTASGNDNPDLFWALRGGGGGNFGVTTSMTFATFATSDSDLIRLAFPPASAVQVLTGWQSWLAGADRNTWGMVDLSVGSAQADCHLLATCPAGTGPGVAEALKSAIGLAPSAVQNKTLSHMDLVTYLAGGSATSPARAFVAGSDVIGPMTSAAAHAIATAIGQWPASGAGKASVLVDPLGGVVADVAPGDTAFPWRNQSAVLQWYVEPATNQVAAANTWLGTAHQAVQQFSVGGYVNYLEANAAPARYYGSNLSRLTTVRQKYDPNRVMFSGLNF